MAAGSEPSSVLGSLEQLSAELGKLALLGASGPGEEEQPGLEQGGILRLLQLREQVKHQQLELQNLIESSEETLPEFYSEDKLIETIEELGKEIQKMKVSYQNKTMVLHRIQHSHALLSKMQENSSVSKLIKTNLDHILGLSASIIKLQQVSRDLEEKVNEVRKKRIKLKELASEIMAETRAIKEGWKSELKAVESEKMTKVCEFIKKEAEITIVVQNVFQRLILGSRVNWAKEPELKNIVLKLEKNVNSF
ncbi:centromere protein H [Discoglossus pictus]